MKVTLIKKNVKKEQEYPFLGIAKEGDVVLFYEDSTGTIIRSCGDGMYRMGYWEDSCDMDYFTPLEGSVLLEN